MTNMNQLHSIQHAKRFLTFTNDGLISWQCRIADLKTGYIMKRYIFNQLLLTYIVLKKFHFGILDAMKSGIIL